MTQILLRQIKQGKGARVDVEGRYTDMSSLRNNYLDRGREFSRMTLPYILPDTNPRSGDANQHGFESTGAELVNHLSNKLTITLFPTHQSFFTLAFQEEVQEKLKAAGYDPLELAQLLVSAEKRARFQAAKIIARVALGESMKHLIIGGNVCLFTPPDKKSAQQAIPLSHYTVGRDKTGVLKELIIMEEKRFSSFDSEMQTMIKVSSKGKIFLPDDIVKLYTYIYREREDFEVAQVAEGTMVTDAQTVKPADLPWIPLRWNTSFNEDYGRGLVEDHAGDFHVMEFLSEALVKGMALMADIKYLVKPGAVTDIDELAVSPAGEFIVGNREDVGILQLEKFADFTPISVVLEKYERRLGGAFMKNSTVRRDAERVTTVELRLDAQELEIALGGIYSQLGATLQAPFARLLLAAINFPFPDDVLPTIVTGLEVLGRAGDLDKIAQFTDMMRLPNEWPEAVQRRTKFDNYAMHVAAALSMELPWFMDEDEFAQKEAAQKESAQQNQLLEEASKAAPGIIEDQVGGN